MNDDVVLDASALLCLLKGEDGADRVVAALPRSVMSAVNLSEVVAKLADAGGSEDRIELAIRLLHLRIEPFDERQAQLAGMLRVETKALGLSLGDRACLALAISRKAVALTTDRAWAALPLSLRARVDLVR